MQSRLQKQRATEVFEELFEFMQEVFPQMPSGLLPPTPEASPTPPQSEVAGSRERCGDRARYGSAIGTPGGAGEACEVVVAERAAVPLFASPAPLHDESMVAVFMLLGALSDRRPPTPEDRR